MAGQFLSSYQRLFNYLCITSKEMHFCQVAEDGQVFRHRHILQYWAVHSGQPASLDPCSAIAGSR